MKKFEKYIITGKSSTDKEIKIPQIIIDKINKRLIEYEDNDDKSEFNEIYAMPAITNIGLNDSMFDVTDFLVDEITYTLANQMKFPSKGVKNLTIWGGEVTIQFQCSDCGYWTGKKKRIPTRYVFHFKQ